MDKMGSRVCFKVIAEVFMDSEENLAGQVGNLIFYEYLQPGKWSSEFKNKY